MKKRLALWRVITPIIRWAWSNFCSYASKDKLKNNNKKKDTIVIYSTPDLPRMDMPPRIQLNMCTSCTSMPLRPVTCSSAIWVLGQAAGTRCSLLSSRCLSCLLHRSQSLRSSIGRVNRGSSVDGWYGFVQATGQGGTYRALSCKQWFPWPGSLFSHEQWNLVGVAALSAFN